MGQLGPGATVRSQVFPGWGPHGTNKATWVPGFLGMAFRLHVPSAYIMTHAGYMQPLLSRFYREARWVKGVHTRVLIPHLRLMLKTLAGSWAGLLSGSRVEVVRRGCHFPFYQSHLSCAGLVLRFLILKQLWPQILSILGP